MTLLKYLTGTLAALAVAVTGLLASATPAKAIDRDDLFRFLLGAATVAIIVHAYNDRNRRHDRRYVDNTLPDYCIETMRTGGRNVDVYNATCLRNAGLTGLPNRCERSIRTNRGQRTVFSANCLFDAGYRAETVQRDPRRDPRFDPRIDPPRAATLPASCELNYTDRGQRLAGYYGDCLQRAGLRNLPERCALRATLEGRPMTIYNSGCLLNAGYQREGSRRR